MDRSAAVYLIKAVTVKDDMGVFRQTTQNRLVYCQVDSVTRAEFFEGGRNGLNPELRFTLFAADYEDEDTILYNNRAYGVYRTYLGRNDTIELYAERKGGVTGGASQSPESGSGSAQ